MTKTAVEEKRTAATTIKKETAKVAMVEKETTKAATEKESVKEAADTAATPKARSARRPSSQPTYEEMIKDVIASLKERTRSSQYAITKFLEEKHMDLH